MQKFVPNSILLIEIGKYRKIVYYRFRETEAEPYGSVSLDSTLEKVETCPRAPCACWCHQTRTLFELFPATARQEVERYWDRR